MPIIVPEIAPHVASDSFYDALRQEQVPTISAADAAHQDIRPARIGLLNLMPAVAMERTEVQWLRHIGRTLLQIDPVLLKFDDDQRSRWQYTEAAPGRNQYVPFSVATREPLDGLIITGANLETTTAEDGSRLPLSLTDIPFAEKLASVVEWADQHVPFTIYSCLAAHFALNHRFGLQRDITATKTFGVYAHDRTVAGLTSPLTADMNDTIRAPHSRWGNISVSELESVAEIDVLAASPAVGWLVAQASNKAGGLDVFIQGHPEYQRFDLDSEYRRDKLDGQAIPVGYYAGNDPSRPVQLSWKSDARALHSNWIHAVYAHFANTAS